MSEALAEAPAARRGRPMVRCATCWQRTAPWLAIVFLLTLTAFQLHHQGRRWWCACGQPFLWAGDVWSEHNSQHLFDPYSFTHILHGFVFWGLLALVCRRLHPVWRLCIAVGLAAIWEVVENSAFVIERY